MIRALYTASRGMVAQTVKQDMIANNIANAQTPGYKAQKAVMSSFAEILASQDALNPSGLERQPYPSASAPSTLTAAESTSDQSEGMVKVTGNVLDFCIKGPGAFRVQRETEAYYTRGGAFAVDKDNELCTLDGGKVQGERGPIKIPSGKWDLQEDGSIVVDGSTVDRLQIAGYDKASTEVSQGMLEQSNVSIIREMVSMIANMRSYEANQKVIAAVDQSLSKLINEGGKV
jgi:flagellar basal-body rod protein FlgF